MVPPPKAVTDVPAYWMTSSSQPVQGAVCWNRFLSSISHPLAGLEKSAAIRPFATKKSRLASETFLLADSFATESCRLADRLATKLFFQGGQRRCGLNVIAQGEWRSLLVQDARELAVRTPLIVFVSKSTPGVKVPSLRFSFRDHLSLAGRRKYRTRCDCQFARHISHHGT